MVLSLIRHRAIALSLLRIIASLNSRSEVKRRYIFTSQLIFFSPNKITGIVYIKNKIDDVQSMEHLHVSKHVL